MTTMRFFNTAGPIQAEHHYHVPPLSRLDMDEILELVARQRYFVLHAPRQSGKTTALIALRDTLNDTGRYRCVYVNVENAQMAREDVRTGMQSILGGLGDEAVRTLGDHTVEELWPRLIERQSPHNVLQATLARWAAADSQPIVLLIDDIDALIGDTLVSVLLQLCSGYADRPHRFPHAVVLSGVRNVRDCRIRVEAEKEPVLGSDAFNIKPSAVRLRDFVETEVRSLLRQHADQTGQRFTDAAAAEVWRLTRGQPWLVNALASEACFAKAGVRDRSRDVDADSLAAARERLILRRETHLDQMPPPYPVDL